MFIIDLMICYYVFLKMKIKKYKFKMFIFVKDVC